MKRVLSISLILVLIMGCKKESFNVENLNGNRIDKMGHGGMGFSNLYPINSLESILRCLNSGADGTEIDVQLTKDGVLVAFHDANLSKSTNKNGIIQSMNWEDVKDAQYNNTHFSTYKIQSLENIFSAIPTQGEKTFTLDIKLYSEDNDQSSYFNNFTDAIVQFFDKHELSNHVYIESQDKNFLALLQSKQPNYQLYHYPQSYQEGIAVVEELGIKGISISTDIISTEQIQEAHLKGIFITLWNVDSKKKNKEAIRKNPDMIQTDKVKHLSKLL